MELIYMFSGLVTVPCRFDLRRYPFGTQTCNITFWADNALITGEYVLSYKGDSSSDNFSVNYGGRRDLGEYKFLGATHTVINNKIGLLSIKLKNLYEFHMLNSFIPSFLICIISYVTLFFPLNDFNERIMVSLTSLLVLAALFTQASESSVITPYFKLLDIWYVILIFFGFLIVLVNILLHSAKNDRERVSQIQVATSDIDKMIPETTNSQQNSKYEIINRVHQLNLYLQIGFALLYGLFLTVFCLSAAEVI